MDSGFYICNVSLIYNGFKIITAISRTKLLTSLKDRAYKLFFPIKGRIILTYFGKDLTPQENRQIGHVFKDKKNITLIIEIQHSLMNQMSNYNIIKKKDNSLLKILIDKDKTSRSLLNSRCDSYNNILLSNRHLMSNTSNKIVYCFECCEKEVQLYCRYCNTFLCNVCRCLKKYNHYNHSIIEIAEKNIFTSVNKYKEILIDDLNKVQDDYLRINILKQNQVNTKEWSKRLTNTINQFYSMSNEINEFIPKVDISSNIVHSIEFGKEHKKMSKELEGIFCSKRNDPFDLFQMINKSEKNISKLFNDVCLFHQYTSIQKKIVSYYKEIEDEIDTLIVQIRKQKK